MRRVLFLLVFLPLLARSQNASLPPEIHKSYLDNNGKPLSGGKIYTCVTHTSCPGNPQATYQDSGATIPNGEFVTLDYTGYAPIFLNVLWHYKVVAFDRNNVRLWDVDDVFISKAEALTLNPVTNGGTGNSTLPVNQILLGNGTAPISSLAPNTAGLLNTLPLGPTGIYDVMRFDAGGYPQLAEFGAGTIPVAQSLVGTLKIADNSTIGHAAAIAGYAQSGGGTAIGGAVGVYGEGRLGGINGAWGANFNVSNYTNTHPAGFAGNTLGIEVDMNNSGTGSPPNSAFGVSAVTAAFQMPTNKYAAFSAEQAASGGFQPFKTAFLSQPGAAQVALRAGEMDITANNSASQPVQFCSRDSGGVEHCGQVVTDSSGNIALEAPMGKIAFLGDNSGFGYVAASPSGLSILTGHINQNGNNIAGKAAGTSVTSFIYTFPSAYNTAPICTATPETPYSAVAYSIGTNTTAAVVTTASSTTATFQIICIGNPN